MKINNLKSVIFFLLIITANAVSAQTITTIAGGNGLGYSGDGGAATSAMISYPQDIYIDADNNIYIADNTNHAIRKINGATGIITTIAGGNGAGFSGDGGPATAA